MFYRIRGASIVPNPDAWAALALPLAMRLGVPLRLTDPVSPETAGSVRRLADIHACWYPGTLVPVQLDLQVRPSQNLGSASGAACFFSGGVDSFYCVRKHEAELTHLIFVHGFDIPLANGAHRTRVSAVIRQIAGEFGKSLIEVETNVREVMDPYLEWGSQYLSVCMSPIPLLLQSTIGHCFLPSDYTYAELHPSGSHPLTTPLLSSPAVRMYHAGAEIDRTERLRRLLDDPLAQAHLRVCWQNVEGQYNCGRCRKCLSTMCALRALGGLSDFPVFGRALDLAAVSRLDCWHDTYTWAPTLAYVQRQGTDPDLERALLSMRRRSTHARFLRRLTNRLPAGIRRWARRLRRG